MTTTYPGVSDANQDRETAGFIVVHGHFYQPPRENPWIEDVEKQESAAPFHDWNERILHECYLPNLVARILGDDGQIRDIVDNYAHMSFNFGPTLVEWMQKKHPDVLARIVESDRRSVKRFKGHGNAIAQAFNHTILPLATEAERVVQIHWGVQHFRQTFGRDPEAMWLPETAVDGATLRSLAPYNLRFLLLSPFQAMRVRALAPDGGPATGEHGYNWIGVPGGTIDTRRPYRVFIPDESGQKDRGRYIDAFFYNAGLSSAIAFERLLSDATRLADRFSEAFGGPLNGVDGKLQPRLVSVCTDGETYGHHEHFGDRGLSYLLKYEFPRRGYRVTNYGEYLSMFPPQFEVELQPGPRGEGTAWSCAHGVGRWKEDCGCNLGTPGFHQKWRGPLRTAFNNLSRRLDGLYEEKAPLLFTDPQAAVRDYIDILGDRRMEAVDAWLAPRIVSPGPVTDGIRTRAMELLEMQRFRHYIFTSCAWFFDDVAGLEAVQNLRYAARAAQLAHEMTGDDYEGPLLADLEAAPCNLPEYGTARGVYEKQVQAAVVSWRRIVANYILVRDIGGRAFTRYAAEHPRSEILLHSHRVEVTERVDRIFGPMVISAFTARFTSARTFRNRRAMGLWIRYSQSDVFCYVTDYTDEETVARLTQSLDRATAFPVVGLDELRKPFFSGRVYSLDDLFQEERDAVFQHLMALEIDRLRAHHRSVVIQNMSLLQKYVRSGRPLPDEIAGIVRHAMESALVGQLEVVREQSARTPEIQLTELTDELTEAHESARMARDFGLQIPLDRVTPLLTELVDQEARALAETGSETRARRIVALARLGRGLGVRAQFYTAQNRLFSAFRDLSPLESGFEVLLTAMGELGFDTEALRARPATDLRMVV
jgi:alpha-amylase/alpha-mannosidase (GH57 family)